MHGFSTRKGNSKIVDSEQWGRFPVEVVRVEPRSYAAFRWASQAPGAALGPGNTTLVEFHVQPGADAVLVTVVESGFAELDIAAADREQARKDNTGGWQEELADLKKRAEAP